MIKARCAVSVLLALLLPLRFVNAQVDEAEITRALTFLSGRIEVADWKRTPGVAKGADASLVIGSLGLAAWPFFWESGELTLVLGFGFVAIGLVGKLLDRTVPILIAKTTKRHATRFREPGRLREIFALPLDEQITIARHDRELAAMILALAEGLGFASRRLFEPKAPSAP